MILKVIPYNCFEGCDGWKEIKVEYQDIEFKQRIIMYNLRTSLMDSQRTLKNGILDFQDY